MKFKPLYSIINHFRDENKSFWLNSGELSIKMSPDNSRSTLLQKITQYYEQFKFPILLTLFTRIGYSLWLAIVWFTIDKHFPLSDKALWETYQHLSRSPTLLGRSLIDVWLRWDAVHYMNLAAFGYDGVGAAETVFFPLYPYLVGYISKITNINVTLIGILTSSFFTLFALIFYYEMIIVLYSDRNLAKLSITLLALYPTAFFLHAPFTEGLFLFCSIGCLLFLVKQKFITAGLFCFAAGLVRPQGILLLIPIAYSLYRAFIVQKHQLYWRQIISIGIAPLGFVSYLIWRSEYGQPGIIQSFQSYSNVSFQDPFTSLIKVAESLVTQPSFIRTIEFVLILIILYILIWMFRRAEFRKHMGIMLYSAATWLLIVSKTTGNGIVPPLSNRYVLHIFFAFVGMALYIKNFPEKARIFIVFLGIALSLLGLTLYSLWVFVG
ncbi:MAG: mannosyltransferase family protein [Bellilinea sp.]